MKRLRQSLPASLLAFLAIAGLVFAGGYSGGGGAADLSTATGTLGVANGGTGITSGTSGGVLSFTASGTIASSGALAANSLVKGGGAGVAPSTITTGTGILTALGVNVGSAGAPVLFNGALGTPSSGTLTSCTGLPINTGLVIASEAQGDILYRNGSNWTRLGAGTSGQFLQTQGAGANPQWAAAGGLSIQTAKTASFTAANGLMYPVDLSAASGDFEVTFPTNTAGTRFGYFVSVPHAANTYGCEPLSTTSIRGSTSHDNSYSLFMKGEVLIFVGDGTTWHLENDGRIPFMVKVRRDAAQSISAATLTKVALDAEEYDNGNIGDIATNDRIDIKRANKYEIIVSGGMDDITDASAVINCHYLNGTRDRNNVFTNSAATNGFVVFPSVEIVGCAAADTIEHYLLHNNTGADAINTATTIYSRPEMIVTEKLQ